MAINLQYYKDLAHKLDLGLDFNITTYDIKALIDAVESRDAVIADLVRKLRRVTP